MNDISMAGASLTVIGGDISVTITEFSDEGTPVATGDLTVAGTGMNLNGNLVTWTKPTPVSVSVSLIPGSDSDVKLMNFLHAVHIGGKGRLAKEAKIDTLVISVPLTTGGSTQTKSMNTLTLTNGRMIVGSPGIGSNAEGKQNPRNYTFEMEGIA